VDWVPALPAVLTQAGFARYNWRMFNFCPMCKSGRIAFERDKVYSCPDCGFHFYQNTAAATGLFVNTDAGILFLRRSKDPAKGRLTVPGGFVNNGEGALDGVIRECVEETGWNPGRGLDFLASFPNVYPYKGTVYHTCDVFFTVTVHGKPNLRVDNAESQAALFIPALDVNPDDLAFESTRRALNAFLDRG
jgi:ADP-ribose pyrophosphatase YjhB (NUDIX family)